MKKVFIILLSSLFLFSCNDNIDIEEKDNMYGEKNEMLSSPNGGGAGLESLNNDDSF